MSYNINIEKVYNVVKKEKYKVIWELKTEEDKFKKRIINVCKEKKIVIKKRKPLFIKFGLKPISLKIKSDLTMDDKCINESEYNPFNSLRQGDMNFENKLYADSFYIELKNLLEPLFKMEYTEYRSLIEKNKVLGKQYDETINYCIAEKIIKNTNHIMGGENPFFDKNDEKSLLSVIIFYCKEVENKMIISELLPNISSILDSINDIDGLNQLFINIEDKDIKSIYMKSSFRTTYDDFYNRSIGMTKEDAIKENGWLLNGFNETLRSLKYRFKKIDMNILTTSEAAEILGCSIKLINYYVNNCGLKYISKIPNGFLFLREDIENIKIKKLSIKVTGGLKLNKSIHVAITNSMEKKLKNIAITNEYENKNCVVLEMLQNMYNLKQYNGYKFKDIRDIPIKPLLLSDNELSKFMHIKRKAISIPHRWKCVLKVIAEQENITVNEIVASCIEISYDKYVK